MFSFHPATQEEIEKYQKIRAAALNMALLIKELCPDSRERCIAFTKIQECAMMANASIAIHSHKESKS